PVNITAPYSPLAQLTSDEYASALGHLLGLSTATVQANPSRDALAPDAQAEGFVNAANRQRVTQLTISGYVTLSEAVVDTFVGNVNLAGYLDLLGCAERAGNPSPEVCTRNFGEELMRRGYRGAFNES